MPRPWTGRRDRAELRRLRAEVQELRRELAAERYAAEHDVLTGLVNRRGFHTRARLALTAAGRGPATMLMLDLDGFKPINDRYGHRVGDRVLVTVATRLADCLADGWLPARLGGDELAALRTGPADPHRLTARATALAEALAAPMCVNGHRLRVGAAIGVATATTPVGWEELLDRADTAMYQAKTLGHPVIHHPAPPPVPAPATRTADPSMAGVR
jgi:diguanylate cyclase (GGDEF)-like protein